MGIGGYRAGPSGSAGSRRVLLLLVGGFAGTLVWALHDLPPGTSLAGSAEPSVIFETADGKPLARKGPFKAADMSPRGISRCARRCGDQHRGPALLQPLGLDFRGIVRAFARNVSAGEVVQGGSTINQQLVKILHLERDRTLKRKIREAAIAVWLDMRLGKDEILTRYLNNVYLGAGATGVPAAARIYFDKSPADLTLAESALLAGLIKAPSQLNPLKDLDAARGRAASCSTRWWRPAGSTRTPPRPQCLSQSTRLLVLEREVECLWNREICHSVQVTGFWSGCSYGGKNQNAYSCCFEDNRLHCKAFRAAGGVAKRQTQQT